MLVVTPTLKNKSSGNLITLRSLLYFKILLICVFDVFSSFLSGKMKAHMVCADKLLSTFSTIFMHPYFLSYGGFIKTFVIFCFLIQLPAVSVLASICSRFVLPSLCISIFAHASAYISRSNSIPKSCFFCISLALSVCNPPASCIIFAIAFTRNPPEPQHASKTLSSLFTSKILYIKSVMCSGVNICPDSDFFLYLLNSLKKIPITSSPRHASEFKQSLISVTQLINCSISSFTLACSFSSSLSTFKFILISENTSDNKDNF